MENNKLSVTPLTDEDVNEFNKEFEGVICAPIRNELKDALDVVLITLKAFYRRFPAPDQVIDELIDATTKAVSAAMRTVDEMDVVELGRIEERSDYAEAAFKLVQPCIPSGVLSCKDSLSAKDVALRASYLRKVLDMYKIISTPTSWYTGSDIGYSCATYLKNKLAQYPGGKTLAGTVYIPGDPEYKVYEGRSRVRDSEHPAVISTLKHWADENVDDDYRDKFFAFLMRHEADIFKYTQMNTLFLEENDEICVFFYRWFLKEQEQAS